MNPTAAPDYAEFVDLRYSQRITVVVRWFLVGTWLFLINYRTNDPVTVLLALDSMGGALVLLNGYVHWRIWRGRPITRRYVVALSVMDLAIITAGVGLTSGFNNTFYPFYYPALLGLSLVISSRRIAFTAVTLVAAAYIGIGISTWPGAGFSVGEQRVLIVRIATMFAVAAAGNLITRTERNRRRDAVDAERRQSERNIELQKKAMEAELAAQEERHRIAREIHDGVAQSIYALTLSLESSAEVADREKSSLSERLHGLVPLAKQTLMETRQYIYDLKPLLSGERDLAVMAQSQVKEFKMITGSPVKLSVDGEKRQVPVAVATHAYRILQEALANVLKHACASQVQVGLAFDSDSVRLSVEDDGVGFETENIPPGYGLENMLHRSEELGGSFNVTSKPGAGTRVSITLPA